MVVACRARLLPLPLPLTLYTGISFLWTTRLLLRCWRVVCCVTVGCLGCLVGACCLSVGRPFGYRVLAPVVYSLVLIPRLPASHPSAVYSRVLLLCWWLGYLGGCSGHWFVHC